MRTRCIHGDKVQRYYVGIDDGEHHDMFFTSDSLFETLCEFNEAKTDEYNQQFEWVEWGVFEDGDDCYIETEDSYFFGGEE